MIPSGIEPATFQLVAHCTTACRRKHTCTRLNTVFVIYLHNTGRVILLHYSPYWAQADSFRVFKVTHNQTHIFISTSQRPPPTQPATYTRDEHLCPQRYSNPRSQQPSVRRIKPQIAPLLGLSLRYYQYTNVYLVKH